MPASTCASTGGLGVALGQAASCFEAAANHGGRAGRFAVMPFGRAAGAAARPPQLEGESKLISGSDDEAQAEARWQTLPEAHTRGGATTYAKRGKKPVGAKPAAAKGAQQPPPQPAAAAAAVKEKAKPKGKGKVVQPDPTKFFCHDKVNKLKVATCKKPTPCAFDKDEYLTRGGYTNPDMHVNLKEYAKCNSDRADAKHSSNIGDMLYMCLTVKNEHYDSLQTLIHWLKNAESFAIQAFFSDTVIHRHYKKQETKDFTLHATNTLRKFAKSPGYLAWAAMPSE